MANEPERPIETLLRAAAKKRRDEAGAPFELHPADRRLLQGEVARRFAKPQPEPRALAALLGQLWPRFAWGVGILAVLGLSVWLLLPPPSHGTPEALLARNQPESKAASAIESPAAATAEPATLAFAPVPSAKANSAEVAYAETPLPSNPTPALQPGMAPLVIAKDTTGAQDQSLTRDKLELNAPAQLAGQQKNVEMQVAADKLTLHYKSPASVASANRTALPSAVTDGLTQSTTDALKGANALAVTQRFVQTAPATTTRALFDDKTPPARAVLASFQLEQTGSQLRIVDGDGSVYSGYVQPPGIGRRERSAKVGVPAFAEAARAPVEALKKTTASSLDSDRLASQTYSFRVAGTNRSLNQQVVFTGDLLPATNLVSLLPAATNLNIGGVLEKYPTAPAQPGRLPLLNSRISGQLVIGAGKAVEINALPASP